MRQRERIARAFWFLGLRRAAIAPSLLRPDRLQMVVEAYRQAGENGARSALEEQARLSALEYKLLLENKPNRGFEAR